MHKPAGVAAHVAFGVNQCLEPIMQVFQQMIQPYTGPVGSGGVAVPPRPIGSGAVAPVASMPRVGSLDREVRRCADLAPILATCA